MRVLVVEDARRLADAIARGLRAEGMAVDVAYDGLEGHQKSTFTRYDVVVLDRDLPGVHGDEVCRELAGNRAETRVLMVTAAVMVLFLAAAIGVALIASQTRGEAPQPAE